MLYYVFRPFVNFFYRLFYSRIQIFGVENIPKGKPVILAANHTNGLLDPLMVAVFMKRGIYFLARADIFGNRFLVWFFNQLHMQPVYRPRDGADYAEKNQIIFEKVDDWLLAKKAVLIFSEGTSEKVRRLRPLKKGTVRMAFSAWEKGAKDLHIVPTGISYTAFDEMRSDVCVSYGKPLSINDYLDAYNELPSKAYRLMTRDLQAAMRAEMLIVDNEQADNLVAQMLEIGGNDFPKPRFPIFPKNDRFFKLEQRIARKVSALYTENREMFEALQQKTATYFEQLNALGTTDRAVRNCRKPNSLLILLLAFVATFLGKLLHFPVKYFKKVATKMAQKDDSMFMTFWSGMTMGFYLVFGLLFLVIGGFLVGLPLALAFLVFLVFLTYWTGIILEIRQSEKENTALENLETEHPQAVAALIAQRAELSERLRNLIAGKV